MCLYITKDAKLKIATKDIVCYKVLKRYTTFLGQQHIMTPYTQLPLTDVQLNGKDDFYAFGEDKIEPCKVVSGFEISNGFVHTCADMQSALALYHLLSLGNAYGIDLVIYECVIPKGTRYYDGRWALSPHKDSYASKSIRFVKEVKF